jgi:dihydropyrimidinase
MQPLDTVIRNARVVTAADTFTSDIGIRDGRIFSLGLDLPQGHQEIDAAGRHVTPVASTATCTSTSQLATVR